LNSVGGRGKGTQGALNAVIAVLGSAERSLDVHQTMIHGSSRSHHLARDEFDAERGYAQMAHDARRKRGGTTGPIGDPPGGRKGIQDRAAYMSFLETQLERVTATCHTVNSYSSRLDQVHDLLADHATKIASAAKLAKIAQTFAEQVEDEQKKFKQLYASKFQRLDERSSPDPAITPFLAISPAQVLNAVPRDIASTSAERCFCLRMIQLPVSPSDSAVHAVVVSI